MDRPVCDESHASGQPGDAHDRDPDDRRVASALRRRLVQDRLVAAPGRALRPRLDLSVHRPRLRRQATRVLQGPALPLRRAALVVREDPGPCVNYRPQLAQLVKQPADGPEWLHELKYDGYRIGCAIERGRATLISRNGNDWTARFREIAKAAAALRVKSALLDGEVCMVLPDGRTSFQALQNAFNGGSRQGLGALLVGYYDGDRLVFSGKVGTGFSVSVARDLRARLEKIETPDCPFTPCPPGWLGRHAHWVKPRLVAEVTFTEWTGDAHIRHPSFQGLRADKDPRRVVREVEAPAAAAAAAASAGSAGSPSVAGVRIT